MKKFSLLSLCFVVIISMSACGKETGPVTPTPLEVKNTNSSVLVLPNELSLPTENIPPVQTQDPASPSTTPPIETPTITNPQPTPINSTQTLDLLKNIQGKWIQLMTRTGANELDEYFRQQYCFMADTLELKVSVVPSETDSGEKIWVYAMDDRKHWEYQIIKVKKDPIAEGYIFTVKDNQIDEDETEKTHEVRMVLVEADVWNIDNGPEGSILVTREKNATKYPVAKCEE